MDAFMVGVGVVIDVLRTVLLSIALVFGAICVLDWAVRARKISPFNAIARFCRSTVDPLIVPIERKVVRAGGTPAAAPLWALAAVVVGGILLLTFLDFIRLGVASSGHQLLAAGLSLLRLGAVELCVERADSRANAAHRAEPGRAGRDTNPGVFPSQPD